MGNRGSRADKNLSAAEEELELLVRCLEEGYGEIQVEAPVRSRALGCIDRMLDFVAPPAAIATPAQGFVPNIGAA